MVAMVENKQVTQGGTTMEIKKVWVNQSVCEIMESSGYIKVSVTLEQEKILCDNGYGFNHVYKDEDDNIWVFVNWESKRNSHIMAEHPRYIEIANVTELLKNKPYYQWVDSFMVDAKLLVEHTEKVKSETYYRSTLPDIRYSIVRVKDFALFVTAGSVDGRLLFKYYMVVCNKIIHGANDISEFNQIFDMPYRYCATWERIAGAMGEL